MRNMKVNFMWKLDNDKNHFNPFKTEAVVICKSMDWFLYDNGLRLERVNIKLRK